MRLRALLLSLLILPALAPPPAGASGAAAVAAVGPDADGAWSLLYDVHRDAPGHAALALDVRRDDLGNETRAARDLGAHDLPAGVTRWNATFLPAEGAGRYTVALLVDGAPQASLAFDVEEPSGDARRVEFDVPDEPTRLNLTRDSVNADGKAKLPGEAVVTRARVEDANGLEELDGVRWQVEKDGALVAEGALAVDAATGGAAAALEHRFERAPLAAGEHRVVLQAVKGGAVVASAARTFVVRDVAPALLPATLPPVAPDADATLDARLVVADRNGAPGAGALEARVYRGSARAETSGVAASLAQADLAQAEPLPPADGAGQAALSLRVHVAARAPAGAYRVSVYANGSLLGAVPLDVLALPTLADVAAEPAPDGLRLVARGSGNGTLRATLSDGAGGRTLLAAPFADGAGALTLTPPSARGPLAWSLELAAKPGGAALDARNGTWERAADGPPLDVTPLRRLAWRVEGADLAGARVEVEVTRWDGAPEPALKARVAGNAVRLDAPPALAPGRYHARLVATFPDGAASEASWSFEAGPWMRVALGEPVVEGREARVPVRNEGGVPVRALLVEVEPDVARPLLDAGGAAPVEGQPVGGSRWRFRAALEPGQEAALVLRLPDGPLPAGARPVAVRVLAGGGA